MTIDDIRNKDIAIPRSKRRIREHDIISDVDLADRIDSLHRAFANERGINERFREEIRAKVRLLLERDAYWMALSETQTQPFPYYQDMLKLFWTGVKRSKLYEYDMIHGINCICCSKILQAGNDQGNDKKSKLGRKPGGRNSRK